MPVEGTQGIGPVRGESGVSRATSFPSSSVSSRGSLRRAPVEEEGSSSSVNRIEDVVTLSDAAESGLDTEESREALSPVEGRTDEPEETAIENQLNQQRIEQQEARDAEQAEASEEDAPDQQLTGALSLRFRQDEETGEDIFQLVERDTGDVVRQIPAEEALEFRRRFEESLSGLIISQQA